MNTQDWTYEQISSHVEKLLDIDSDNLDAEALRNNKIFVEINNIYIQQSRKLAKLIRQKDQVEMKRYRHYNGKMPAEHYKTDPLKEVVLKGDIPQYMSIDPLVSEIRELVREQETIVKFLEESKGTLRSRSFDVKNAIEFRKLMMGM